ncbi:response regulator [Deinococcus sp. KSM4-11]|uniref:response regulator n=1 Tax=Deinococcus sp. KSM4-11 TaxID=2568654 RepID=UPI0010A4F2FB|nr:response regulator [Deinococcus sp. KSM4-11]THF84367.1 response regulator [Deinococcus sp. KSM4-11]
MKPTSLRVLLVDDNPVDLELAHAAFSEQSEHTHLTTLGSGAATLTYLRDPAHARPDVVLLDIHMPLMSGFEVLQTIKGDPALQTIPVVMLSTSANPLDTELAYRLFASSYLVKEASLDAFQNQVEAFVRYWEQCKVARQVAD